MSGNSEKTTEALQQELEQVRGQYHVLDKQSVPLERRLNELEREVRARDGRAKIGHFFRVGHGQGECFFTPYLHPVNNTLRTLTISMNQDGDGITLFHNSGWVCGMAEAVEVPPAEVGAEVRKHEPAWYTILKQLIEGDAT